MNTLKSWGVYLWRVDLKSDLSVVNGKREDMLTIGVPDNTQRLCAFNAQTAFAI